MNIKHFFPSLVIVLSSSVLIPGCDNSTKEDSTIKVGVISGPEQQVAEKAVKIAKNKYNLNVELIPFNDYIQPNEALNNKDLDVNAIQHIPYLERYIKDSGYNLVPVGNTLIYPIAAYSQKIKSIDEISQNATIVIPNDPTNLGRSLLLLQQVNLIKLKDGVGLNPTILDIVSNPKELIIKEIDGPQLPRALEDNKVLFGIINNSYLEQINKDTKNIKLFTEDKSSPYVNVIVAREDNKNSEKVKNFVKAYQTEEVLEESQKIFNGGAERGW